MIHPINNTKRRVLFNTKDIIVERDQLRTRVREQQWQLDEMMESANIDADHIRELEEIALEVGRTLESVVEKARDLIVYTKACENSIPAGQVKQMEIALATLGDKPCERCLGDGVADCPSCGGIGKFLSSQTCAGCGGSGIVRCDVTASRGRSE